MQLSGRAVGLLDAQKKMVQRPTKSLGDGYLDDHAVLRHLVQEGNIPAILQQPSLLSIFDLTCTLCCRRFKRKNDLQAHILNIHAQYWKQVEALVMKLVQHYQGSAVNCYCTPKTRQWGKHQCSVFRQFALLRYVVFPDLSNENLIPRPVSRPPPHNQTDETTPSHPKPVNRYMSIMDCLRRPRIAAPLDPTAHEGHVVPTHYPDPPSEVETDVPNGNNHLNSWMLWLPGTLYIYLEFLDM